jgi:hypothetical protein
MFRQFITFFLIVLLTVSVVVGINQVLPSVVEQALAKSVTSASDPAIAKATIENLLLDVQVFQNRRLKPLFLVDRSILAKS